VQTRLAMAFGEKLNSSVNKGKGPAMAFNEKLEPNGTKGKRLRILSIDGGGVRGIIPAIILQELENALKEKEGENEPTHHLCEYFDMIAGTSSGGLITAMITTPKVDKPKIPIFNAREVVAFFDENAAKIFPEKIPVQGDLRLVSDAVESVFGSVYSAHELEVLLKEKFDEALLSLALTSVIIPAFDTEKQVPVFFSNLKGVDSAKPLYDVQVKDACRATTAAPIFFPAANIKVDVSGDPDQPARTEEFNVIDGGIAVNDPTLVAVTQEMAEKGRAIAKEQSREIDFRNVLVLSLGTGQHPMRFVAKQDSSSLEWLLTPSGLPLVSSFFSASGDMVEYYTSMIFDAHQSGHHYLRIQTERLSTSEFWGIDDATKRNLDELTKKARELLGRDVSKRNFATGELHAITDGGSNKQALGRFARWLVEERREREQPTVDSSIAESSQTGESSAGAVQTAVNWCPTMRKAVGGCCSMTVEAILVVKRLAVYISRLCIRWLPNW